MTKNQRKKRKEFKLFKAIARTSEGLVLIPLENYKKRIKKYFN